MHPLELDRLAPEGSSLLHGRPAVCRLSQVRSGFRRAMNGGRAAGMLRLLIVFVDRSAILRLRFGTGFNVLFRTGFQGLTLIAAIVTDSAVIGNRISSFRGSSARGFG